MSSNNSLRFVSDEAHVPLTLWEAVVHCDMCSDTVAGAVVQLVRWAWP
jgi:hypothetical protein